MEKKILYFEKAGRDNSNACLECVRGAMREGRHRHLVVASTTGTTGLLFTEAFKESGLNLVVVTHSAGFRGPNTLEMEPQTLEKIR
ncbi:MAG: hypothetical protein ACLP29_14770, partial [Dissulfurispiraceae bacterium]